MTARFPRIPSVPLEPPAADLPGNLATDVGAVLIGGSEMQAEKHSRFDHLVSNIAGAAVETLLSIKDVSCGDQDFMRKEVFYRVCDRGSCTRMTGWVLGKVRRD